MDRSFVERRGGWILSVCLHVMFFTALLLIHPEPIPKSEPHTQTIHVTLATAALAAAVAAPVSTAAQPSRTAPAEAAPQPVQPAPRSAPQPSVAAAAATPVFEPAASLDATLTPSSGDPSIPEGEGRAGKPLETPARPAPLANLAIGRFDGGGISTGQGLGSAGDGRGAAGAGKGSPAIAQRIQLAQADLAARKTLFRSRGAAEGVARGLDTSDVSDAVAQKVLARYGIEIVVAQLDNPGAAAPGYLNQATMRGGTFVNAHGKGVYKIFTISQAAMGRMMELEQEALRKNGLDPAAVRLTSVLFGIVPTTGGYDLGVKKIETKPVAEAGAASRPTGGQPSRP
ncbi:MAG: hypothetical protein M1457_12380 [bacterium]|nr:hypothetical protein [bacterium]